MPENDEMSQETEIAVISENMKNLAKSFDELKETLEKRDTEIHNHINRKISDDIIVSTVTLKSDMVEYVDNKIKSSEANTKSTVWTWATILIGTVILSFGSFIWITAQKETTQVQVPAKSTASEMTELFKMIQEASKPATPVKIESSKND